VTKRRDEMHATTTKRLRTEEVAKKEEKYTFGLPRNPLYEGPFGKKGKGDLWGARPRNHERVLGI